LNSDLKIAYFGLSHLGIVSAISLASKQVRCVGVDLDSQLVGKLARREWPIEEPGIEEVYNEAKSYVTFSSDPASLRECDIIYISQDVPTDDFGKSDLSGVEALINLAAQNISRDARIVILCQVPPGFTRRMKENHSNISYQVETLIFGQAFSRAITPERIIVGVENPDIPLDTNFAHILGRFSCPILLMDFESAEFTKISINAFLAAAITTTNSLNEVAKSIGANWGSVKNALQLDRRIGPYAYLKPGLGISGGNIERDLQTLDELETNPPGKIGLFRTFLSNSHQQKKWIIEAISKHIIDSNPKTVIGILGVAYKENTHSTKNAVSLEVLNKFAANIVGAYDPLAVLPQNFSAVKLFDSAHDCIMASNAIVVMTPWEEFSRLDFSCIPKEKVETFTVIDPYGIIDRDKVPKGIRVRGLTQK
jgi:UDPglucose 6-dehydrogenase